MSAPKLESLIRKVKQPKGGYIPIADLNQYDFGGAVLSCRTGFSPMLLSSIVQQITAFCACNKEDVITNMTEKIDARLMMLDDRRRERELELIDVDLEVVETATQVDASFIRSLCRLYTYAPQDKGGHRRYPDGGYIEPIDVDVKLIWSLARRAYSFLYEDSPEWVEFKTEYVVNGASFSSATVDFTTPYAAYKITPSPTEPPNRDILLAFVWAVLAKVDNFGIYNPMTDILFSGKVSNVNSSMRKEILGNILNA